MILHKMTLKEAYEKGRAAGYASAIHGDYDPDEFEDEDDAIATICEIEQNSRQFSPFEFTATEINAREDPESAWDEYDRGVIVGARKGFRERKKTKKKVR